MLSKFVYAMRINGDRLDDALLSKFDESLRATVENTLGGKVDDTAWWQAQLGVTKGAAAS